MRKMNSLYRYYALRDTFCANKYEHCFTALRRIARSYRKYYMKKLASLRAWCHFEIVTILSDAHFFTPSKKSGALINGGSGYPKKSFCGGNSILKVKKRDVCPGALFLLLPGTRVPVSKLMGDIWTDTSTWNILNRLH